MAFYDGADGLTDLPMIRFRKAQRCRRAIQSVQVPPYGKGAAFGHLQRLEHTAADHQTVVSTGDSGLVWILVDTAVQPDPELAGQAVRGGCGELHPVRLSGCSDQPGCSTARRCAGRGQVWTPVLASAMVSDRTRTGLVAGCGVAQLVEHHLPR